MIDPNVVLILDLRAGYTRGGRSRGIALAVNAQGFVLAASDTASNHPASNLRDAWCPGSHVVVIGATVAEINERRQMARASGRLIAPGRKLDLPTILARAERVTEQRLAAIA